MGQIDRKFRVLAVNPENGKIYDETTGMFFCAHDKAVPKMLMVYAEECEKLHATPEHIRSIFLLRARVIQYQTTVNAKVPDTEGAELDRCLDGRGLDDRDI